MTIHEGKIRKLSLVEIDDPQLPSWQPWALNLYLSDYKEFFKFLLNLMYIHDKINVATTVVLSEEAKGISPLVYFMEKIQELICHLYNSYIPENILEYLVYTKLLIGIYELG